MFEEQLFVFESVWCNEEMRGDPFKVFLKVVWRPPSVFVMHVYAPECRCGEICFRIIDG